MATWVPISGGILQRVKSDGKPASGYVLKLYAPGTTTNIPLATDATGLTTATTALINSTGDFTVSGNTIIPHIDQDYKLAIYPTQEAADLNSGATVTIDYISTSLGGVIVKSRYLVGASNSVEANLPSNTAADDIVEVTSYSSDSVTFSAKWKCTDISASLPSGAVAGDVTGNARGVLYILRTGSSYYSFEPLTLHARAFGAQASSTTTANFQAAVNYCEDNSRTLDISGLMHKNSSPILVTKNTRIIGDEIGFTCGLRPQDCAAIEIDGDNADDGFAFNVLLENFLIWCVDVTSATDHIILINDSYRCKLDNIRITACDVGTSNISNIVKITGTQYLTTLNRVMAIGTANSGAGNCFYIGNSSGHLTLRECDAEDAYVSFFYAANARVDNLQPYSERAGTAHRITSASSPTETPMINIRGGSLSLTSGSSTGVLFSGTFANSEVINIDGLKVTSNDHATKNTAFGVSSLTWSNANKIKISGMDWSWIGAPNKLRTAAEITPYNPYYVRSLAKANYCFQKTGIADNTATDIFSLGSFNTSSPYPPVYVKIKAFASFNGYGRAIEESVFVIQDRSDANAYVSTKQIIAQVREDDAANYSITTFFITATESSNAITFSITSDFNTAVQSSLRAHFDIEVIGEATLTVI